MASRFSSKNLTRTECDIGTARGLMQIAHFVFDNCEGDDWQTIRPAFGFLLNAISQEMKHVTGDVETLYREHFVANSNGTGR